MPGVKRALGYARGRRVAVAFVVLAVFGVRVLERIHVRTASVGNERCADEPVVRAVRVEPLKALIARPPQHHALDPRSAIVGAAQAVVDAVDAATVPKSVRPHDGARHDSAVLVAPHHNEPRVGALVVEHSPGIRPVIAGHAGREAFDLLVYMDFRDALQNVLRLPLGHGPDGDREWRLRVQVLGRCGAKALGGHAHDGLVKPHLGEVLVVAGEKLANAIDAPRPLSLSGALGHGVGHTDLVVAGANDDFRSVARLGKPIVADEAEKVADFSPNIPFYVCPHVVSRRREQARVLRGFVGHFGQAGGVFDFGWGHGSSGGFGPAGLGEVSGVGFLILRILLGGKPATFAGKGCLGR